jgi:anti-sigma B factor antagonist
VDNWGSKSRRDCSAAKEAGANMMQVTEETRNGWRVVTVTGRADHETADALESALRSAVEANAKVAADFSALNYISSVGLRAVVQAARAAQTRGSEFAICGISGMVRKVFEASGLHQILRIHGELPC